MIYCPGLYVFSVNATRFLNAPDNVSLQRRHNFIKYTDSSFTCTIKSHKQYLMAVCSVYILVNWTKLRSPYIWLTNIKCHIFRKKPTYWDWGIFWIRFDAWNKYRWTITQTSWIIIYIYIYIYHNVIFRWGCSWKYYTSMVCLSIVHSRNKHLQKGDNSYIN